MVKRLGYILIDIAQVTIIDKNIDYYFWSKVILIITYIKNLQFTSSFKDLSSYKKLFYDPLNFLHLQILRSIFYILIYKEKHK